jgi:hypothetical protein
MCKLNQVLAG